MMQQIHIEKKKDETKDFLIKSGHLPAGDFVGQSPVVL